MSTFVISGGLHSLCSLFAHKNLVVRMNAICTFVNITAHKDFNWFRSPRNSTELRLHRALIDLREDPSFLSGLISNSWGAALPARTESAELAGAKTFPGGCIISLEVKNTYLVGVLNLYLAFQGFFR